MIDQVNKCIVGWVERSDTDHVTTAIDGLRRGAANPSYAPATGPNQGLATAGMGRINLGRQ